MEFFTVKRTGWKTPLIAKMLLSQVLLFSAFPLFAMNQLVDVKFHDAISHQVDIELIFKDPIKKPDINVKASPAQLIFQFNNSQSSLVKKMIPIKRYGVKSLSTVQLNNDLRIELALSTIKPYQSLIKNNRYRIMINDAVSIDQSLSKSFINDVTHIDFHRNQSGGGKLIVQLNNASIAADVEKVGAKLEVKFHNTSIKQNMLYVMDVKDFATPINHFETFMDELTTRLLLDISGSYEYSHYQEGNRFILEVNKSVSQQSAMALKKYQGKNLSLNFQNIPVRTVLQIIADYNNFNLVTSDTVTGDITLKLDDVPWDQALDLILQTKGLDKRIQGNILMIAPADELANRESQQLKNQQEVNELAPLYSEYVQINYAKVANIAELLKNGDSSLLSARGTVAVDERTNTLLVKDTSDSLTNIKRLVQVLDIPIRQVLIESRMVTVKDNVAEDIGVRWGVSKKNGSNNTSGSLEGSGDLANGNTPSLNDRLNVNLPSAAANSASIAFHVAKLADNLLLDLELSALEQENKGEIIASPRITTSNQKSAYIEQGVEIPYVESSSSGATSVSFKKAVLSLRVTPQITPDNKVILDLEITQDSKGSTVATSTGEAVSIDTQRIGTQVLVDNGETIVLGGIYQQNLISRVSKVPILGDIPYLGFFFRNTAEANERQELLIFVTPKIVTDKI